MKMEERIHEKNAKTHVICHGQEINEQTFAIAKETLYNNFEEQYFSKFYSKAVVNGFLLNSEMFNDFLSNNQLYESIKQNLCKKIYQQYHEGA